MNTPSEQNDRKQMRLAGGVIAIAILVWLLFNLIGQRMGWSVKLALFVDFATIGAMVWSLLVTLRVWRRRADTSRK